MRIGFGLDVARLNIDESVTGLWSFTNPAGIRLDDINEFTPTLGVLIDGVLLKDGGIDVVGVLEIAERAMAFVVADNDDFATGVVVHQRVTTVAVPTRCTGFAGGVLGRIISIINHGVADLVLRHLNPGSAVANRFQLPGASDFVISVNEGVWLRYDDTLSKWFVLASTGY